MRSVTSNTRNDAREFLAFAGQHHIEVTSPEYPLGRADQALSDLSARAASPGRRCCWSRAPRVPRRAGR